MNIVSFETQGRSRMVAMAADAMVLTERVDAHPLISVVVAVFNGTATLQRCIDSVAAQTYPYRELIVIDGGSKDGTVELLEANREKLRYWISEPDRGIYHAWNKALRMTNGEWICFLGADDYFWDDHVLANMADKLEKLPPDLRVVYGRVMLLSMEGAQLYPIGEPWECVRQQFRAKMCLPHPGLMHRRSLFVERGGFDESFRIAGDYELLLRELKTADAVFVPGLVTVGMRSGGGKSSHPASALLSLYETRRAQRMHGQRCPSLIWLAAIVRVYLRLLLWRVCGEPMARKALDIGRRVMGQPAHWTKT